MIHKPNITRRRLLADTLAVGAAALAAPFGRVAAEARRWPTPGQIMGPFYPAAKPLDQDADLTVVQGRSGRAQGQVIHLMGRVLNLRGESVADARVEIWQANTHGRYTHPTDQNDAPLDPNFEGFGIQTTDSEGRYRFQTIKPGAYPVTGEWMRPPHIHFDITGGVGRLITQMYFEGEILNAEDRLLQETPAQHELIARVMPPADGMQPDSMLVAWDVIIPQ